MSDPLTPDDRAEVRRAIEEVIAGRPGWDEPHDMPDFDELARQIEDCVAAASPGKPYLEIDGERIAVDLSEAGPESWARYQAAARRVCAEIILRVNRERQKPG